MAAGSATQRQLPVLDEATLIDTKKKACLLCKRQFPSIDVLNKHVQLSDLHKVVAGFLEGEFSSIEGPDL